MSKQNLPNPFECARRIHGVSVLLKPEDVMDTGTGPVLSRAEAERLLDEHGSTIAAQMLVAGINAAVDIISEQGGRS